MSMGGNPSRIVPFPFMGAGKDLPNDELCRRRGPHPQKGFLVELS
jgi:hypothetical protein